MSSEGDEIKAMVEALGRRFARVEEKLEQLDRRPTADELQAQVEQIRQRAGLPVPSLREKLIARGVPPDRANDALTCDPGRPAMVLAARLARGEGRILVLASLAGRGKSTAAAYALTFRPGLWVHSPALARAPTGEPGTISDSALRDAGLLVIDDLGTEHSPKGYAASRVNDAVVWREGAGRPTLITTNLDGPKFREVYGDRLASRVNSDREPLGWQTIDGPDLRSPNTPEPQSTPTLRPTARNPPPPTEVDR